MKESLLMLSHFLKNPKEIGSVAPSSRYLRDEIIKNIDFKNSKNIIELGPGFGVFTKAILKKMNPDSKLICFEINRDFCIYLSENNSDSRLTVVNASADSLRGNLNKLGIVKADCIVSGLPFRNFPISKKKKIIMEVKNSLNKNGRFILFQYTKNLSKMLESCFGKISRKFIPLNIPPSFVYVCEK